MNLEPGKLVTENLRLLRRIGEGGMGSVWVAEHLALDTEVAIKFMAPELASNPDMVARFTREAKSAAQMRSPHVVRIFDYAAPKSGVPYMVMELLDGEDLESRVSKHGRMSLADTVDVVAQIAKALREAHALGIVHRDVKPENVFLASCAGEPFVKVLDFGIAKHAREVGALRVTCSGTTIGTPIYMSPEQILSAKDVDYRCDLWSLAVVAYFCLTGRVPFEGETYGAVCISIDRGRMTPPSQLRSDVPKEVDAWFAKALARDIDRRFRSAQEMAEAFVVAMGGATKPLLARSSWKAPSWKPQVSWSWRAPASRRRTLGGATIARVDRAAGARSRVTAFASIVAVAILFAGGLDLGRVWFGRGAHPAATLLAAPSLAITEPAQFAPPPPVAATQAAPIAALRPSKSADVVAAATDETPKATRPRAATASPSWTAKPKKHDLRDALKPALATEPAQADHATTRDAGAPPQESVLTPDPDVPEITPVSTSPPDDAPIGL